MMGGFTTQTAPRWLGHPSASHGQLKAYSVGLIGKMACRHQLHANVADEQPTATRNRFRVVS